MQRFLPQIRQLSTSPLCNLRSRSAIPRPTFNRADNVEHTHVNSDVGYRFNYHKPGEFLVLRFLLPFSRFWWFSSKIGLFLGDRLPRFGRQKDEDVPELQGGKPEAKTREVDWTFGANDYIDILGTVALAYCSYTLLQATAVFTPPIFSIMFRRGCVHFLEKRQNW